MPSILFNKISLLILLILLLSHPSLGRVEVFNNGIMNGAYREGNVMKKKMDITSKVDAEIDYDDGGPNPGHDPNIPPPSPNPRPDSRKGRPGGGGSVVRKLIAELDAKLDYDYGGPNPRHDPRKGRSGGGGGW